MSSPRADNEKGKLFEIGLPSSEDSFTPSETSEKYEDVANANSSPKRSKKKDRTRKQRSNSTKNEGSMKNSTSSTRSSEVSPIDRINEGVQTDDEYLERLSPRSDAMDEEDDEAGQVLFPKRHVLLLMIFLGFVNIYAMRVNLNVAIVAMVNNKTIIMPTGEVKKIVCIIIGFVF